MGVKEQCPNGNMEKRYITVILFVILIMAAAVLPAQVFAADTAPQEQGVDLSSVYTYAQPENLHTKIQLTFNQEQAYLFLPASVDLSQLPMYFSAESSAAQLLVAGARSSVLLSNGDVCDLTALCGEAETYQIVIRAVGAPAGDALEVTVKQLSQISAMYLVSDDPENQGRQWVEASEDKSNKATGSMCLQAADSTIVYDNALTQIKGRGNSTWAGEKKPYQIKLAQKADLLQTGKDENKNKTWVLLANYYDGAKIRNAITFDLAAAMGMDSCMEYTFVDLFYDGEYRGLYTLCEKVSVDAGRVDVRDLEEENERVNAGIDDLTELETAVDMTENGAEYVYCVGMQSPEDITGGYLLEFDYAARAQEEMCYFLTSRGNYVVVKSPECCSKEEMDYIASLYQAFEDAVFNGGTNPETGKAFSDYVELESIVQCYLINEWSKNPDSFRSSAYLYKDAGENQMRMGPVWDYDLAYGLGNLSYQSTENADEWFSVISPLCGALYQIPEFREKAETMYRQEMYPLVQNVLLGSEGAVSENGSLHTWSYYVQMLTDSAAGNDVLWPVASYSGRFPGGQTYASNLTYLRQFITQRSAWLLEGFSTWLADPAPKISYYFDVDTSKWYAESIREVTNLGLMNGTSMSHFSPELKTTRAQVVQVLFNMSSSRLISFKKYFTDVDSTDWFAEALTWGYENGIALGFADGSYRPNTPVSRQETVVLLYRYAGEPEVTGDQLQNFADADLVMPYAAAAMQWAVETGVVQGYTDGTLRPKATATRAEFATMMLRAYAQLQAYA